MRKVIAIALVAAGALFLTPRSAHAQGFWRFFERLSGPTVSGPGFELIFECRGVRLPESGNAQTATDLSAAWFPSPLCSRARRDRWWLGAGFQVYQLAGDNDLTPGDPDDRVDVLGFAPVLDVNTPWGFAVSGSVGVRSIATPAGKFTRPIGEVGAKFRPVRMIDLINGGGPVSASPSFRHDFIEFRVALMIESAFEAGDFGRGSRALADPGYAFSIAFNLLQ